MKGDFKYFSYLLIVKKNLQFITIVVKSGQRKGKTIGKKSRNIVYTRKIKKGEATPDAGDTGMELQWWRALEYDDDIKCQFRPWNTY